MKLALTLLPAIVLLLASAPALADNTQAWAAFAVNGPVKDDSRFLLWFDAHARFRDDASELGTTIIRPGIGWRANNNLSLWAGYARVTSHQDGPNIKEDRIWQQATYKVADVLGGRLSGRTRIEQRFRNTGGDVGLRIRQSWRWARPIEGSDFSFVAANETFIGVNNTGWGQDSGYDQNRAFLGLAWAFAPSLRLEGGYLNNHIDGGARGGRTNHNVSLALFAKL